MRSNSPDAVFTVTRTTVGGTAEGGPSHSAEFFFSVSFTQSNPAPLSPVEGRRCSHAHGALLRFDRRTETVLLSNPCVYQPVFVDGVRLLSSGEVAVRNGSQVEVLTPREPPGALTLNAVPGTVLSPHNTRQASTVSDSPLSLYMPSVRRPSWLRESVNEPEPPEVPEKVYRAWTEPMGSPTASDVSGTSTLSSPVVVAPSAQPPGPVAEPFSASRTGCRGSDAGVVGGVLRRSATRKPSLKSVSFQSASPAVTPYAVLAGRRRTSLSSGGTACTTRGGNRTAVADVQGATSASASSKSSAARQRTCPPLSADHLLSYSRSFCEEITIVVRQPTPFELGPEASLSRRRQSVAVLSTLSRSSSLGELCTASQSPLALRVLNIGALGDAMTVSAAYESVGATALNNGKAAQLECMAASEATSVLSRARQRQNVSRGTIDRALSAICPRAAAAQMLDWLAARHSGRRRRPSFVWEERHALYCLFTAQLSDFSASLRAQPSVLALRSPIFCVGGLNGAFSELWGHVVQRVCPFGRWALLTTPLLFLGGYLCSDPATSSAEDESVEVVLALVALSVAFPESVHLLRDQSDLSTPRRCVEADGPFRARCAEFFGEHEGRAFWVAVSDALSALPPAAAVDNAVVACHSRVPAHLCGHHYAKSPSALCGLLQAASVDPALAGVSPDASLPGKASRTMIGRSDAPSFDTSDADHYMVHCSSRDGATPACCETCGGGAAVSPFWQSCTDSMPTDSSKPMTEVLRPRGQPLVLRGQGCGPRGLHVSPSGQVISVVSAGLRGGHGAACAITRDGVQLLSWRAANGRCRTVSTSDASPESSGGVVLSSSYRRASSVSCRMRRSSSVGSVHYVMGIPLPVGPNQIFNLDFDDLLTPSSSCHSRYGGRPSSALNCSGKATEPKDVEFG